MRTSSILFLAISAAIAVSAPAFAQDPAFVQDGTSQSVKVSLAGLDLNSREGAAAALRRIDAAAASVCGDRPDAFDLPRWAQFERCRLTAVDGAVRTMNRPLLSLAAGSEPAPVMVASR